MKRNIRRMKQLTACLVLVLIFYFILQNVNLDSHEEVSLKLFDLEELSSIQIDNGSGELLFLKANGSWIDGIDGYFPLDKDSVETLENLILDLSYTRKYDEPEELSSYGLEEPSITLTLDDTVTLKLGNTTSSGEVYCQIEGEDSIYTISNALQSQLLKERGDYIALNTLSVYETTLETFTLNYDHQTYYFWQTLDEESEWIFEKDETEISVDEEVMDELISLLTTLKISGYYDYYADDEELEAYGLDDGNSLTIQISAEETTLLLGNTLEDGNTLVLFQDTRLVETVDTEIINELIAQITAL